MRAAEPSDRCDGPDGVHGSVERSILVERKVRTRSVIVAGVLRQQEAKVAFPQHHDMVEAVASNRADQPLNMTVLPRRTWRDGPVSNAHGSHAKCGRGAVDGVAVTDQVAPGTPSS